MKLQIEGIIESATRIQSRIEQELAAHSGLAVAVGEVITAANHAKRVSQKARNPWSINKLPALFLALALLSFLVWIYWNFLHVSVVSIAIPSSDFTEENLRSLRKKTLRPVLVDSSAQAIEELNRKKVDFALIQGGILLSPQWVTLRTPSDEWLLWMTKPGKNLPKSFRSVLTGPKGEGSHSVAIDFFKRWGCLDSVEFVHEWSELASSNTAEGLSEQMLGSVDATFMVINLTDPEHVRRIEKLLELGFEFQSPYLGIHAKQLGYPEPALLEQGYIQQNPPIPAKPVHSYRIPIYLVARQGVSSKTIATVASQYESAIAPLRASEFEFDAHDASEVFQGVDAFLGILINIILAFLALLGLEMWIYRKRFHELNSLVSLLSMLQSNKDVLGEADPERRHENLLYLSTVSDVLGLISAINGYYTQENSSLLFNNQSEVIHERCDNLKLNIQLKILHAGIPSIPSMVRSETTE
jgi:hypothetical protein